MIKRGKDISKLATVLDLLMEDKKLPSKYKEHPLKSNFKGYMDCHIEPDWLLIYRVDHQEQKIYLARTGTHSDLF
jgi:mRNA interferase YafQ